MIAERHYDDEALIAILDTEAGEGKARDPHLAVCRACADTLTSYRAIADVLGDDGAWDLKDLKAEPVAETAASLRAFAARMSESDDAAEELLKDLLSLPRASWLTAVQNEPRFVNPGVVRRLVEKSEAMIDTAPADAAALVRAAVDIAERLDSQQLRGAAWRQYAYALFYTGDYTNASDAVDLAHSAFEKCVVADYDLARVGIVRALIFTAQERYDEAYNVSRWSARIFRAYGDRNRLASALLSEAYSLLFQSRYEAALPILLDIQSDYANAIDTRTRAVALSNIGLCYWQTGRIADALPQYQLAAEIYEELGIKPEATRNRVNVAALLASQGRHTDAKVRLREAMVEFDRFGMPVDAVSAGLILAEVLLVESAHTEVEALCRRAIVQFRDSGVAHSAEALVALSYLREAAEGRRATPEVARHVKTYIERLPKQPKLQFAPPPLPPE